MLAFFHGTDKQSAQDLVEAQTYESALLGKRDHGFFGAGFYVAGSPSHARHYGPHVLKITLRPSASVLTGIEEGKSSGIIPTDKPSWHRDFMLFTTNQYLKTLSKEEARAHFDRYDDPTSPDFDRITWYKMVTKWAKFKGYSAITWGSETIILNPKSVMEISYLSKQKKASSHMLSKLNAHRSQMAKAAQAVYEDWEQDEEGVDDHYGEGGICDDVAGAIAHIVDDLGYSAYTHYCEYDTHTSLYVYNADVTEICLVDIHPHHYESGYGYKWKKKQDVVITADMVTVEDVSHESHIREMLSEDDMHYGSKGKTELPTSVENLLATAGPFTTGKSLTFQFLKNPEKAPDLGSRFGQDVEPAGYYCSYYEGDHAVLPHLMLGTAKVSNPLVVKWLNLKYKNILSEAFGKKKLALTKKLIALGYDAIVSVDGTYISEIILLKPSTQILSIEQPQDKAKQAAGLTDLKGLDHSLGTLLGKALYDFYVYKKESGAFESPYTYYKSQSLADHDTLVSFIKSHGGRISPFGETYMGLKSFFDKDHPVIPTSSKAYSMFSMIGLGGGTFVDFKEPPKEEDEGFKLASPRLGSFQHHRFPAIIFEFGNILVSVLHKNPRPSVKDFTKAITDVLRHELLHAVDWAYSRITDNHPFNAPRPALNTDDKYLNKRNYFNIDTELKSHASDVAHMVWDSVYTDSARDIRDVLNMSSTEFNSYMSHKDINAIVQHIAPENKKMFTQRVLNTLQRLGKKALADLTMRNEERYGKRPPLKYQFKKYVDKWASTKQAAGNIDLNGLDKDISEAIGQALFDLYEKRTKSLKEGSLQDFIRAESYQDTSFIESKVRSQGFSVTQIAESSFTLRDFLDDPKVPLLKNPHADLIFKRTLIGLEVFSRGQYNKESNTVSFKEHPGYFLPSNSERGARGTVTINIGYILAKVASQKSYPFARDFTRETQRIIGHELLHAADWAYHHAVGKDFAPETEDNKALEGQGVEYYNMATELKSYAHNVALDIWHTVFTKSPNELHDLLNMSYAEWVKHLSSRHNKHVFDMVKPENRKTFTQRVIKTLQRWAIKALKELAAKQKQEDDEVFGGGAFDDEYQFGKYKDKRFN